MRRGSRLRGPDSALWRRSDARKIYLRSADSGNRCISIGLFRAGEHCFVRRVGEHQHSGWGNISILFRVGEHLRSGWGNISFEFYRVGEHLFLQLFGGSTDLQCTG